MKKHFEIFNYIRFEHEKNINTTMSYLMLILNLTWVNFKIY